MLLIKRLTYTTEIKVPVKFMHVLNNKDLSITVKQSLIALSHIHPFKDDDHMVFTIDKEDTCAMIKILCSTKTAFTHDETH